MSELIVKAGETLVSAGQSFDKLCIMKSGRIRVCCEGGSYELGPGDVVGICEVLSEVHILSYIVVEDTSFFVYPVTGIESIDLLINSNPDIARICIRSCFRQITRIIHSYRTEQVRCNTIYDNLTACYNLYLHLAEKAGVKLEPNKAIEQLEAYYNIEDIDYWLMGYYEGLNKIYAGRNFKALIAEPDVSIGMIKKGCIDVRKAVHLISERHQFIRKCLGSFFIEKEGGLFYKLLEVYKKISSDVFIKNSLLNKMTIMISESGKVTLNANDELAIKIKECTDSFKAIKLDNSLTVAMEKENEEGDLIEKFYESLDTILDFAEIVGPERRFFRININKLKKLKDKNAIDDETTALKREITAEFYQIYSEVFFKSLKKELTPVIRMFLYFGYIDEILAGEEYTKALYKFSEELKENDPAVTGVYTFYDWLLAVYRGEKKPCRNELEVDFSDYVRTLKSTKKVTNSEAEKLMEDGEAKVCYELDNIFKTANKITCGRVSTFCPVFYEDNILKELESCMVKPDMIRKNINAIKSVDFSAFYRETLPIGDGDLMAKEHIHVEKLPDFILMPNAGVRGIMWQEIEGKVRTTPSRMFISILHMDDLLSTMIKMTGEFRWEICKRVQGGRWNDVTDPSLTSLYCDYIQFYRKNSNLTPSTKEKIKISLQRCRNSFKDMFVQDYLTYILYEGKGSPRLNKVARRILFEFCPPDEEGIRLLANNPTYMELVKQWEIKREQKLQKYEHLERRLLKETGSIPLSLKMEIDFVKGKQ